MGTPKRGRLKLRNPNPYTTVPVFPISFSITVISRPIFDGASSHARRKTPRILMGLKVELQGLGFKV